MSDPRDVKWLVQTDADLPVYCLPCLAAGYGVWAVAIVGQNGVCADCLDGHNALADLQLEALERWEP